VLATVAFIRYLDLEVSLVVVAAVLTVLGYSLNDTRYAARTVECAQALK
jgi:preprotein translocase subunit SecF